MQPNSPDDKQYEDWGVTPPTREAHGRDEDIAYQVMRPVRHGNWKQQGNVLICTLCSQPHATEPIPVDYILKGTDDQGLPILKKLDIHKL